MNQDTYQSKNDFDQSVWDDAFNIQGNIEGSSSPVNYADAQVNFRSTPEENWIVPQYEYMREQIPEVKFFFEIFFYIIS